MKTVIFAGPSLPPRWRPADALGIEWRPPVRQGELYRAALARPAAIGVVDGYFEVVPTSKQVRFGMPRCHHVACPISCARMARTAIAGESEEAEV